MAQEIKHVGKIKNTGVKVAVVFRTIPGDSDHALVIPTAQLPDQYHDSLMTLIETAQAQEAFELGEVMFRNQFPNGTNMLTQCQNEQRMVKESTSNILMTPIPTQEILLSELNQLIAEQKNTTVDQLHTFVSGAPGTPEASATTAEDQPAVDTDVPADVRAQASDNGALSDVDLAKSYRSQADGLYKEAARLRREADELDPPKKKAAKAKVAASA